MSEKETNTRKKRKKKGTHTHKDSRTGYVKLTFFLSFSLIYKQTNTNTHTHNRLLLERPEKMTCVMCGRLGHLTPKNRKCSRTYREEWEKLSEPERLERLKTHQRAYIEQCNKKRRKLLTLPSSHKPSSLVFKDKIFSLSLNGDDTRQDLINKIERSGGKITGQIHKNVHALLCSKTALECKTQRVRKARKRNVPIVLTTFIDHCISQNKWISPLSYSNHENACS